MFLTLSVEKPTNSACKDSNNHQEILSGDGTAGGDDSGHDEPFRLVITWQ